MEHLGDPRVSSYNFFLRYTQGDLIYAQEARMDDISNIEAKIMSMLQEVRHCSTLWYDKIMFKIDSLFV